MAQLHRFLVEQYVPQLDRATATAVAERLEAATGQLRRRGTHIRWINAVALLDEESVLSFIDADSVEQVLQASGRAGVTSAHVQEVIALDEPARERGSHADCTGSSGPSRRP